MDNQLLTTPTERTLRRQHARAAGTFSFGHGLGDAVRDHPDPIEVIEFDEREDARLRRSLALGGCGHSSSTCS